MIHSIWDTLNSRQFLQKLITPELCTVLLHLLSFIIKIITKCHINNQQSNTLHNMDNINIPYKVIPILLINIKFLNIFTNHNLHFNLISPQKMAHRTQQALQSILLVKKPFPTPETLKLIMSPRMNVTITILLVDNLLQSITIINLPIHLFIKLLCTNKSLQHLALLLDTILISTTKSPHQKSYPSNKNMKIHLPRILLMYLLITFPVDPNTTLLLIEIAITIS